MASLVSCPVKIQEFLSSRLLIGYQHPVCTYVYWVSGNGLPEEITNSFLHGRNLFQVSGSVL